MRPFLAQTMSRYYEKEADLDFPVVCMQHIKYTRCERCQMLPEEEDDRVSSSSIKPRLAYKYTVQLMVSCAVLETFSQKL